jgi:ribonuclease T2
MVRRRVPLAGFFVVMLCSALLAQFHRKAASRPAATPARFDYYLLSLSWAPEFCSQPGEAAKNPRECATGLDTGFVVHGLWPQMSGGKDPEFCGSAKKVSTPVVNFILPYMPSPSLIQHEWAAHGTCTGLSQSDYFTAVLQARAAVQLPVQITALKETANETPSQIEAQFVGSNPSFPEGSFRTGCRNGAFTEARVCFDKQLKPQLCTASAGECSERSIAIRPPI